MLETGKKPTSMPPHFNASIRAIAHPVRRKILQWLKEPALHFPHQEYGHKLGICVGQITRRCGLSPSTVSQHVALLREAALVDGYKTGNSHFLKRNETRIQHLNTALKDVLENQTLKD